MERKQFNQCRVYNAEEFAREIEELENDRTDLYGYYDDDDYTIREPEIIYGSLL